ncbi:glycosyltransferase involved in cell wall biosynthesis [Mucilaginibacter yixingensis]|uniref:Glycosyltransferase involved in cell wall biosynthesis n=2 Tax=Mucilaginibacter yixingensis TaxID=1295612 RepID=A0A2T5J9E2_9SPHI|nr:glycosyltransferase involved in cell wall biosynthesis [Mucilaginibacter yixingensis]
MIRYHEPATRRCLFFMIPTLGNGGAERVMINLANHLVRHYKIVLISLNDTLPAYPIDERVDVHYLIKQRYEGRSTRLYYAWLTFYKLMRLIIMEKPYKVISFITSANLWTGVICFITNTPYIVSERTSPQRSVGSCAGWKKSLLAYLYRKANAVVVSAANVGQCLSNITQFRKLDNLQQIPNAVTQFPTATTTPVHPRKFVLGVGRLVRVKGFDILIDAFALLHNPDVDLLIVGDGEEREDLEAQCNSLGLYGRVFFTGAKSNIQDYYAQAEVFVLPSRNEGYPNALIEAMSFGCACVAVDCDYGPREIIKNGQNGLLVPQNKLDALANGMNDILTNKSLKEELQFNATQINYTNSPGHITSLWEQTIFQN